MPVWAKLLIALGVAGVFVGGLLWAQKFTKPRPKS